MKLKVVAAVALAAVGVGAARGAFGVGGATSSTPPELTARNVTVVR